MDSKSLYQDIATRTNGDIYIGVVGPVRSGKSTFLKKFMDELVLPNMTDLARKQRVIDELPQSANGKTVMTTEPKFVPDMSANIDIAEGVNVNVRLIDCVGYMVKGVENQERLVNTPWSDKQMTFVEAAELGTQKVMRDHSTIGVVVTTDGSVTDFARDDYVEAEGKIITEMKASGKPFVVLVNTRNPNDKSVTKLVAELSIKYGVSVIAKNVATMMIEDVCEILECILGEFPIKMLHLALPKWMQMLPIENEIIHRIMTNVIDRMADINRMSDYIKLKDLFDGDDNIKNLSKYEVRYSDGSIVIEVEPSDELFYIVLSDICSIDIKDESQLFSYIKMATGAVSTYDKMSLALESVEQNGYGVMVPSDSEIVFSEPEFVSQGGKRSINMSAKCACLHIMKIDVDTVVNPILAGGSQGQDMVNYLESEYLDNPSDIWKTNMFGKELAEIAREGLSAKMYNMPVEAQVKLRRTVARIVNEGKGGVLCVLL